VIRHAALILLIATAACSRQQPASTPPPTARNLLFVTIDTLRADHVGVYGATTGEVARLPFVRDFLETARRECFAKLDGVVPVQ